MILKPEPTPAVHGEFLMVYHGKVFVDDDGSKYPLTIPDIYYIALRRKNGKLHLKSVSNITDEDAQKMEFYNAFHFKGDYENWPTVQYKYQDALRKMGYATEWRGHAIEEQIEFGWIELLKR